MMLTEPNLSRCLHLGKPCPTCGEPLGMVTMLGPAYVFDGREGTISAYQCGNGHGFRESAEIRYWLDNGTDRVDLWEEEPVELVARAKFQAVEQGLKALDELWAAAKQLDRFLHQTHLDMGGEKHDRYALAVHQSGCSQGEAIGRFRRALAKISERQTKKEGT